MLIDKFKHNVVHLKNTCVNMYTYNYCSYLVIIIKDNGVFDVT